MSTHVPSLTSTHVRPRPLPFTPRLTYAVLLPLQIVFEDTSAELIGSDIFRDLPRFDVPSLPDALKPPRFLRSAGLKATKAKQPKQSNRSKSTMLGCDAGL
eukprot:364616-Chlamydomonas_euryale.AAC.7